MLLSKKQQHAIGMLFVDEAFTDVELAKDYGISPATVRAYGANVYKKCVIRIGDRAPGSICWKGLKNLLLTLTAPPGNIAELKFSTFCSLIEEAVARNALATQITDDNT